MPASRPSRVIFVLLAATAIACAAVPSALAAADASASWSTVQGGAGHPGVAPAGAPEPPLRAAWSISPTDGGSGFSAAVVGDGLAVATGRTTVVGIDPVSGDLMWTVRRDSGYLDPPAIGQTSSGTSVVVYAQGRLGATSSVVAIDLESRQQVWRFPAEGGLSQPLRGAPAIDDGAVYLGGHDGFVYALDLTDGHLRWKFRAGGEVAAAVAADGGRVFAVGQDLKAGASTLFAIDAASGKQAWSTGTRGLVPVVTSPTVADGVLYVGGGNGTFRAYAADTGRVVWSTSLRGVFLAEPSLVRTADTLYVMAATGSVYRLDPATGDRVWDYQFRPTSIRGAPIVVGNFIVLGLDDGTLAAIDVRTGNLAWTTNLAHRTFGPLAPAGDVLIASTVGDDGGSGGLVGLRHVEGPLTSIESPTKLHLGTALVNAVAGGAAVVAGFLVLFRAILRRSPSTVSVGPSGGPEGHGNAG